MAPVDAPLTVTETVLVPFATTDAGLTATESVAEGKLFGLVVDAPQPASVATARTAERTRIRRDMDTSTIGPKGGARTHLPSESE